MSPTSARVDQEATGLNSRLPGSIISSQGGQIVSLEGFERHIREPRSWHDDDVQRRPAVLPLIQTKNLANDPLRAVPAGRATKPPRCHHTKSSDLAIVWEHEKREKPTPGPNTPLLNTEELRPPAKPFLAGQSSVHRC